VQLNAPLPIESKVYLSRLLKLNKNQSEALKIRLSYAGS